MALLLLVMPQLLNLNIIYTHAIIPFKYSSDTSRMEKATDLSDFDKEQIVMARRLGTIIMETAKLVGCSRTAMSIYGKWLKDGETTARRWTSIASSKNVDVGGLPAL